jgi:hypothetical protein
MNEGLPLAGSADTVAQTTGDYAGELINAIQVNENWTDSVGIGSLEGHRYNVDSNGFNFILNNNATGSGTAIVDVYTIKCIKDIANSNFETQISSTGNFNLTDMIEKYFQQSRINGSAATSDIGLLPFAIKQFCQHFKIVKVQEVQIPAGNTITMSMRSPKNWQWTYGKMVGKWCIRGLTQGFLFRARGAPDSAAVTGDALDMTAYGEYHTCLRKITTSEDLLGARDKT